MFTHYRPGNALQKAACMLTAVVIVSTTLSLGALAAKSAAAQASYSVTITQLA